MRALRTVFWAALMAAGFVYLTGVTRWDVGRVLRPMSNAGHMWSEPASAATAGKPLCIMETVMEQPFNTPSLFQTSLRRWQADPATAAQEWRAAEARLLLIDRNPIAKGALQKKAPFYCKINLRNSKVTYIFV